MKTSELRKIARLKGWQPVPEAGPALAAEIVRLRCALKESTSVVASYLADYAHILQEHDDEESPTSELLDTISPWAFVDKFCGPIDRRTRWQRFADRWCYRLFRWQPYGGRPVMPVPKRDGDTVAWRRPT